jgi:uncharacterized damage-inducible protein DinB
MLVEYSYSRRYLFTALASTPVLFDNSLRELAPHEADLRPDPERFSIREIMAHLAHWEAIFLGRMQRVCDEEHPELEDLAEGQLVTEHNYAATDPLEQSRLFGERRAQTVAYLQTRTPKQWHRLGNRPEIGLITLEALAMLLPLHDIYHLQQIAAWRDAAR